MSRKSNGFDPRSPDEDPERGKLIRFPAAGEREAIRRERQAREDEARARRGANRPPSQPFFNLSRIPPFTRAMVLAFAVIHAALFLLLDRQMIFTIFLTFGFTPGNFTGATGEFPLMSALSPLTYMFLHGSWTHLGVNALMMFSMGTLIERAYGARAAAIVFFLSGLAGAAASLVFTPFSGSPVIGASAGISGLFGAGIMLISRSGGPGFFSAKRGPWPLIAFWVALMVLMGVVSDQPLAWQSHVGGFLAGIALMRLVRRGL